MSAELPSFTAEFDTNDGKKTVQYRPDLGERTENVNEFGTFVSIYRPKTQSYRKYWLEEKVYFESKGKPANPEEYDNNVAVFPQRKPCDTGFYTKEKKKLKTYTSNNSNLEDWQCEHKSKSLGTILQQYNVDVKLVVSERHPVKNLTIFEAKVLGNAKPDSKQFDDPQGFKRISEEGFRQRLMRKAIDIGR